MPRHSRSLFGLILWPSILTLLVSGGRLLAQTQGWVATSSGGGGVWLGITWLVFVFGGWFGHRLARDGSRPRLRRAWLFALLSMAALAATVVWRFSQVDLQDSSEAAFSVLRDHVLVIAGVALVLAVLQFFIWPRLALVLLGYGLVARGTVLGWTWLAKQQGWDTHYTKFGPAGIERDMAETMLSASVAQLGVWVPFTIVGGMLVGCLLAGRRRDHGHSMGANAVSNTRRNTSRR